MASELFITTSVLYALACLLYLGYLVRGMDAVGTWATRVLVVATLAHVGYLFTTRAEGGAFPIRDIHETLSFASLIIVVAYLIASFRYKIAVLGGFITPVTLLFFLGAGIGRSVAQVPADVRSALLPFHIGVNVLGIAAFTLAFATALGYVIQEALLRRKKLGGMFQRLPALDVLDSLGFRLVTIGFPLLTIGIVTGTIWAVRLHPGAPAITGAQGFALLAWVVFAGVLLLRVAAGWRGRRAAIGTMVGFACATAVLVGYFINSAGAAGG